MRRGPKYTGMIASAIVGQKAKKPRYIGYYSREGYNIWLQAEPGHDAKEVYRAGNNPAESTGVVPIERGVGLRELRKWCFQTGREIAAENGGVFIGAQREPEAGE